MAHEFRVEVISAGRELSLSGRLDSRSAHEARSILHAEVASGCGDLLVHIGELEIWDASGLGVIVGAHRKAQGLQRRFVLTDVPPRQLRLLRATRLHRMLTVEPAVA